MIDAGKKGLLLAVAVVGLKTDGFKDYKIGERATEKQGGVVVENLVANGPGGGVLRVERVGGVSAAEAKTAVSDRVFKLRSIYDPHEDPYFAALTKKTVCPAEFSLRLEEGPPVVALFFSNERLTYGACTREAARYRTFVSFMYCQRTKSLFTVESFIPTEKFTDADVTRARSLKCL
jgi:hypothetical protein